MRRKPLRVNGLELEKDREVAWTLKDVDAQRFKSVNVALERLSFETHSARSCCSSAQSHNHFRPRGIPPDVQVVSLQTGAERPSAGPEGREGMAFQPESHRRVARAIAVSRHAQEQVDQPPLQE